VKRWLLRHLQQLRWLCKALHIVLPPDEQGQLLSHQGKTHEWSVDGMFAYIHTNAFLDISSS